MFDWLKKRVTFAGSVFFRGTLPPRAGDFAFLTQTERFLGEGHT